MRPALLLIAALAACGGQARAPLCNVSHAVAATPQANRPDGPTIEPELYRDLALVKSFEGMHQAVTRHGLDAAARVFEHVRWKGMSRATVAELLGEPTSRDADDSWRYDLDYKLQSVFLKLRFTNGVVERVVYGDAEIRRGDAILE